VASDNLDSLVIPTSIKATIERQPGTAVNAMDSVLLRQQLAEYLGVERFQEFVAELRIPGGLRHWQELAWAGFLESYREHRSSLHDLRAALRVCELHEAELIPDRVPVIEGNVDYTQSYTLACRYEFPNANVGPVYTEGRPKGDDFTEVWYCPGCRSAHSRWCDSRKRPRC
jgi:hypothetical protein